MSPGRLLLLVAAAFHVVAGAEVTTLKSAKTLTSATATKAATKAHNSLRPHGSHLRHHARPLELNKLNDVPVVLAAGGGAAPTLPVVSMLTPADLDNKAAAVTLAEGQQNALASQLDRKLAEVKQRRDYVGQLQTALAAEVALLRESTELEKVSESRSGRIQAEQQVRKSEQLVKDTSAMLRESRSQATEAAKAVLAEVAQIRSALDELEKEATDQIHTFTSGASVAAETKVAPPETAEPSAAAEPKAAEPPAAVTLKQGSGSNSTSLEKDDDLDDDKDDDLDALDKD